MNTPAPQVSIPPQVDSKLVFVVDDEASIGDVIQIMLRREGYATRFFAEPDLALQALLDDKTKPALLLTDYIMTPINGMQLIDRCKRCLPELKTILFSGNAGEEILQSYQTEPDAFLRKPFPPKMLMALVRRVLTNTGPALEPDDPR